MLCHPFRAMGTDVELLLDAPDTPGNRGALQEAEAEVRRLEGLLSRFQPQSELGRLNRDGGVLAGPELMELVVLALDARLETGGRFDPTVHDAVRHAGYDRSFPEVPADHPQAPTPPPGRCGGAVRVDAATRRITLEPGVRLDLGGIAKGYTADRVAARLNAHGPCLVNVGGDLAVRGVPADGAWTVGVQQPEGTLSLDLRRGAIATSGRDRRRWRRGGHEQHHLIDPRTARPARTDLLRVSVVAASAARAEVLATSLLLAGSAAAAREADDAGVPCVLVREDAPTIHAGGL